MRKDDTYEFIGTWDDQFKAVGFQSDVEGRPIERLIRCKDCKYWQKHDCWMKFPQRCKPDDGCSKGEPNDKKEKA